MKNVTYKFYSYATCSTNGTILHMIDSVTGKALCGIDEEFHTVVAESSHNYVLCGSCLKKSSKASFRGKVATFYESEEDAMEEFKDES